MQKVTYPSENEYTQALDWASLARDQQFVNYIFRT